MVVNKNIINVELGEIRNSCFVVMPFDPLFDIEYERVLKMAIEEVDLECIRADQIFGKPRVMDDIWKSIRSSRVIVAELTDRNPNVLYEVGLAHAIGKPVIIITRNEEDVPFDLRALRYLFYDINDPDWGRNLKTGLVNLLKIVLDEPKEMGKYLEGIEYSSDIVIQELKEVPHVTEIKKGKVVDVSGFWQGGFGEKSVEANKVILSITQNGNELSATMTITYLKVVGKKRATSVVQETFTGNIKGDTINLTGVNYSYVKRGMSIGYRLDNFELKLSENDTKIIGRSIEEGKGVGIANFEKR